MLAELEDLALIIGGEEAVERYYDVDAALWVTSGP